MSETSKTFRIGIICGSQRKPRVGDQITKFVLRTIQHHLDISTPLQVSFDYIDIANLPLPFYDEPGIPSEIHSPEEYVHQRTRDWSRRIAALDGFVFVTPQYNWGVPAALKNAIDYLFNEWKGKPAMIVSYGGHGGEKAAQSLKLCLAGGIKMIVGDKMIVNLSFPDKDVLVKAVRGLPLDLDINAIWASEGQQICDAWDEMAGSLASGEGLTHQES
jgi:NAD(P)H-dependent FMN reductase